MLLSPQYFHLCLTTMPAALEHSKNRIRRELDNVIKLVASRSAIGPLSR
jgi:hypothetical protein